MSNGAEVVADALMDSLLVGESFTLPTVNLNDPAFQFPSIVGNPLYAQVSELTNEDLTTRTVGGTGTFDAIMQSQANHLKAEFTAGRITGADYAKAYVSLAQGACSQAVQFLLGKDQAYWASVIAQGQALTARVQLETAKAQLALALVEVNNQRATFALNKIRLANEDAQYGITKYNLANTLPAQLAHLNSQNALTVRQADAMDEEILIKKQQVLVSVAEVAIAQAKLANIPKEGLLLDAQTSIATYNVATKLPAETAMLTSQKTGQDKNNEIAAYTLTNLNPAQLTLIKEQGEVQRAQTLDVRADGAAVSGSVKSQKDLYAQQVVSYQRSAQLNAAKVFADAFTAESALTDGAGGSPTAINATNVSAVLTTLRTVNSL